MVCMQTEHASRASQLLRWLLFTRLQNRCSRRAHLAFGSDQGSEPVHCHSIEGAEHVCGGSTNSMAAATVCSGDTRTPTSTVPRDVSRVSSPPRHTDIFFMLRSRGIGGFLAATVVGVASGYYIFQPLVQQSVEKMRAEATAEAAQAAKAPLEARPATP